jgi:ubiquinone/menaquinone biosynthesis C-methylase UbiE
MSEIADPNQEAIEAWNTVLFEKFSHFRWLLTEGLGRHGSIALDKHVRPPAKRVLDMGCGFGDTTLAIASQLGPGARVVGVDAAARFIGEARKDAATAKVENAEFVVADVAAGDLGGPYEIAFSRFGTMFFASAVQALRNVGRALVPGGSLCMVVWRKREDNPWLHVPETVVREIIPEQDKGDAVTCGPGPFSMSGADLVSDQLIKAGYSQIAFERVDLPLCIGRNLEEAVEFAMSLGPAGEIVRLAGAEGERLRPQVESALRKALARFSREDGVYAPSSTWIVTARH